MDIVSACLIGCNCKWDGTNNKREDPRFAECFPICPELSGGLGIPRDNTEIINGRVITRDGKDITADYERGAQMVVDFALAAQSKKAYLKERSPSCGAKQIYDGTFTGKLIEGEGVLAAALRKNGIEVVGIE